MDKNKAIELLKQALNEIPQLRKLHYDNQEFKLWRNKVQNIIKAALDTDDLRMFSSGQPILMQGWFSDDVYQKNYLDKLTDYETALKSIIQKYELLGFETEGGAKTELPKAPEDYEKKAGKELELMLEGTPDMIIECIMNFVKKLDAKGYAYKCIPRIGGAPDYARWDKTYSAHCTIVETQEGIETQIGTIELRLLPNERTLFIIPETEDWDSPFGKFIGHLLGEFKRLGFVYFEEEKPPMGFRPHHEEKNV